MLLLRRALRRHFGSVVGREGFGEYAVDLVSPAAVVFDDMIRDLGHVASSLALDSKRHGSEYPLAEIQFIESDLGQWLLEHDLVRKPISTFRDHALAGRRGGFFAVAARFVSLEMRISDAQELAVDGRCLA